MDIKQKALRTIEANIVKTQSGDFITAGGNQFRTLWVRDFCYSVPGLLSAGYAELVRRQFGLILSFKNEQHFLPRGIDVINPKMRVVINTVFRNPGFRFLNYTEKKLIPEYLGEHLTPAFDSNLLFLQAASQFATFTGESSFLSTLEVNHLLSIYLPKAMDLISQPAFSDWQDSVERSGNLLLTQILYLQVVQLYRFMNIDNIFLITEEKIRERINKNFYDSETKIFFEQTNNQQHSLDSNCFIAEHSELLSVDKNALYNNLKISELWTSSRIPGRPVDIEHKVKHISWTTRLVGLRPYHDRFIWGWLTAEAYKIAKLNNDKAEMDRILDGFSSANLDSEYLAEVYEAGAGGNIVPVKRMLYRSECPFT
jgi:hypothetical protein